MRAAGDRLSTFVSARHYRCARFVPELGFEILRDSWPAHRQAVETDERISRRKTRSIFASAAPLPARQHFIFLRRKLQRERYSIAARQDRRETSGGSRGRDQQRS